MRFSRLESWKQSVSSHSGAAAWIKRRLASPVTLAASVAMAFTSVHQLAARTASDLACRWNVGVFELGRQHVGHKVCHF